MRYFSFLIFVFLLGCKNNPSEINPENSNQISHQLDSIKKKMDSIDTINSSSNSSTEKHIQPEIDFLMGKFDPDKDHRFVLIDIKYADRSGLYIQNEVYDSYKRMYESALQDGIKLVIRSATRNFDYQKNIWERKWLGKTLVSGENLALAYKAKKLRAKKILLYSSMPGSSRHHWGTDIDLNSFDNEWFENGEGKKLYNWLQKNANEFGFCQVYTKKTHERPNGYEEEKWHWSYIPLSRRYTNLAGKRMSDDMFDGFLGSNLAKDIHIVSKYVLGVNKHCL